MDSIFLIALGVFVGVILAVAVPKVFAWGSKVFTKAKAEVEDFKG